MELLDLVRVGSSIRVNTDLSNDRLSQSTLEMIDPSSKYIVKDFKITDGKGIGVIIELPNGDREWFFENEVEIFDAEGKKILHSKENSELTENSYTILEKFNYRKEKSTEKLLNPLNFLSWLIYSVKDIF